MAKTGMEMLLGQMGIDPQQILKDFKALTDGVNFQLGNIHAEIKATRTVMEQMQLRQEELWNKITNLELYQAQLHQSQPQPQNRQPLALVSQPMKQPAQP